MERIKPLNDFVFKKLFGEEDSKDNLMALLNAILSKKDKDKLVTLEIINNKELTKEMIDDKTGILDVRGITADGMQLDIEVQLTNQNNMDKRTIWYWGKLFNEGIKKGEDYETLSKVITINILDFKYISLEKFHTTFHLWEDETKDYMLTDLIEIHFIEVSKFKNLKERDLVGDKLQRWLTFFKEDISQEELKELIEMDEDIKKAEEKIEYLSNNPETLALYRAREKSLHDRVNMVNSAKSEGIAQGIAQGITQGKVETAINLINMDIDISTIAKATGLSTDEINTLKESNH